jgi:hypothetical protein
MNVLRPRNRVVYFRVSEDEYLRLAGACHTHGLRSISDAARLAVEQLVEADASQGASNDQIAARLTEAISELTASLNRLLVVLGTSAAGSAVINPPDLRRF